MSVRSVLKIGRSESRERRLGSAPVEIHLTGRRRDEQFLPAYCQGRSKAELNHLGIPRAALYTLNWLRIMRGGGIRRMFLVSLSFYVDGWSQSHVGVMTKGQGGCLSRIRAGRIMVYKGDVRTGADVISLSGGDRPPI